VSSLSSELYLQLSFKITGGQSDELGQSEEEITATMAERQHLCTGGRRWMTRQEPRWRRVVAVDGAAAAAASAVAVNGGRRSGGGWRWQVDARPKSVIGGGRRQQVAIAHCCILCRISPHLLCRLRRRRRWCRMTTRRRVGDLLHCRGCQRQRRRRRGGRWPACHRHIKYPPPLQHPPPTSPSPSPLLSTADVASGVRHHDNG
jgi:hypothetical protein